MATTQAPLFGLDASGSIGGALTFAKWRGRTYCRVKSTPSNPRSGGQKSTRAMMKFLAQIWTSIKAADGPQWATLAAQENYSTFNAFVRYNMKRWTQFTTPYNRPTPTAGAIPVMGALTLTAGIGQFSVSQVITTPNQIWGMLIAVNLTPGFTPAKGDIWYVAPYTTSPVTAVLTNLAPATYKVRTAGFDQEGELSAYVAEGSVIVS